jgi:hypothetical protein
MRTALAACLALLALACAPTAPVSRPNFERTRQVALAPDDAWRRILEFLASEGILIRSVDRASGVLYAEQLMDRDPSLADCGSGGSWRALPQTALSLNVFVRPNGSGSRVTVNSRFTQMYASGIDARPVLCFSTGALEGRIFGALL